MCVCVGLVCALLLAVVPRLCCALRSCHPKGWSTLVKHSMARCRVFPFINCARARARRQSGRCWQSASTADYEDPPARPRSTDGRVRAACRLVQRVFLLTRCPTTPQRSHAIMKVKQRTHINTKMLRLPLLLTSFRLLFSLRRQQQRRRRQQRLAMAHRSLT